MTKGILNRLGLLTAIFILPFILLSCLKNDGIPDDGDKDKPQEILPGFTLETMKRNDGGRLLAIATIKNFDAQTRGVADQASTRPTTLRADGDLPSVQYPFDAVEIQGGSAYTVSSKEFPVLRSICGDGELIVIVSAFSAYKDQVDFPEGTNPGIGIVPGMQLVVSDGMIVFRGALGLYSCLLNGGQNNISYYSSHKKITDQAVIKDVTPPIYTFCIWSEVGGTKLGFKKEVNADGSIPDDMGILWADLTPIGKPGESHIYPVEELTDLPQASQVCTITEKQDSVLLVSAPPPSAIKKVLYDSYTVFSSANSPSSASAFKAGDVITITYDKLFEGYQPEVVFANTVVK